MIEFPDQIIRSKGKSMNIVTVGIDLAKNVFDLHGVSDIPISPSAF